MIVDWSPLSESGHFDAACHMRPLLDHDDCDDPWYMYSYERPADMVWNAIGQKMADMGFTVEQIKFWMQSKDPRHALDGSLGDLLKEVATDWVTKNISPELDELGRIK